MLLKQISDFEQLIILERAKFDKEKKELKEECLIKNLELVNSAEQKQKALDEEKRLFALEKKKHCQETCSNWH